MAASASLHAAYAASVAACSDRSSNLFSPCCWISRCVVSWRPCVRRSRRGRLYAWRVTQAWPVCISTNWLSVSRNDRTRIHRSTPRMHRRWSEWRTSRRWHGNSAASSVTCCLPSAMPCSLKTMQTVANRCKTMRSISIGQNTVRCAVVLPSPMQYAAAIFVCCRKTACPTRKVCMLCAA
jgi:hypothetical protein